MTLFVHIIFFATLAGVSLNDLGSLDSSLGAEWIFSWGLLSVMPLVAELMLEYGWATGLIMVLRSFLQMSLFYVFQNKLIAESVKTGMRTGEVRI